MPMICSKIHDLLLQCSKDAVKMQLILRRDGAPFAWMCAQLEKAMAVG